MGYYPQEPAIESTNIADAAGVNIATVSADGAIKIDGSSVIQPVSGTVVANIGAVAPGNVYVELKANASSVLLVDSSGTTQPISATSLPLPTGAATSALQTTGNTSLASIDAGTPAALGQTTMSASMPVVIASDQSIISVTTESTKPTYAAAFVGLVVPAAPTDVFTITGSATKVIRITSVRFTISTTAGSGILINASLIKRSTADTGGTSTVAVNVPYDSNNAAGTAVVRGYTVNPTLGTAIGPIRAIRYAATPAAVPNQEAYIEFGTRPAQTVILRGTSQQLCVNFGSTSITGDTVDISVEWTEE